MSDYLNDYLPYIYDQDSHQWVTIGGGASSAKIYYGTKAEWAAKPSLVSEKHSIYVYTDGKQIEDDYGQVFDIPTLKIGDGLAYVVDLPFSGACTDDVNKTIDEHVNDMISHITQEEREFWNNKVRCYIPDQDGERIIFTTK